ncbi:hypothetical protein GCM10027048_24260 [Hymenobacter coalescens]
MSPYFYRRSVFLAIAFGAAVLSCRAQLPATASPTPDSAAAARSVLLKLGTGLTRGLTVGGYMGTALPVVAGAEWQLAPAWSAYGNVSSAWRVGPRTAAPDGSRHSARVMELGVEVGVRRYYRQPQRRAAGRAAGPFVGNYVALQGLHSLTPSYSPRLHHEVSALAGQWGMQRRLGGHGLIDAYVGGGLETRRLSAPNAPRLSPHLEAGLRLSLVR